MKAARFCVVLILGALTLLTTGGCATVRTTDPPRTATEQFLLSVASQRAVDQLSVEGLRGRVVFVDDRFVLNQPSPTPGGGFVLQPNPLQEFVYLLAEVRSRLLLGGARLTDNRADAQVIVEVRTRGVGIDRFDYYIGLPAVALSQINESVPDTTAPQEIAFWKTLRQYGYASVAIVAYWRDTGEVVAASGPYVGTTSREDTWIFGFGPNTTGDIPPVELRR